MAWPAGVVGTPVVSLVRLAGTRAYRRREAKPLALSHGTHVMAMVSLCFVSSLAQYKQGSSRSTDCLGKGGEDGIRVANSQDFAGLLRGHWSIAVAKLVFSAACVGRGPHSLNVPAWLIAC
jgi:hypothetical protein